MGLKSEFMDHKALLDVSLFYIDWTDIQVPAFHPFNAGKAKSEGGDSSVLTRRCRDSISDLSRPSPNAS